MGHRGTDQIIEVSIDKSVNYRGLVEKLMPDANIVADRFHVMKLVGSELNSAIIKTNIANETITDEAEKARMQAAFKQSKYAILKPEENLTADSANKIRRSEESNAFAGRNASAERDV